MAIPPIRPDNIDQRPSASPRQGPSKPIGSPTPSGFAALLNKVPDYSRRDPMATEAASSSPAPPPTAEEVNPNRLIPLDEINWAKLSVSHLLTSNLDFQHESRDITFAKVNQDKQFNAMPQGDKESLDLANQEFVWAQRQSRPAPMPTTAASVQSSLAQGGEEVLSAEQTSNRSQIIIGSIDRNHPTISHLLKNTPQYRDKAWNIIFSAANRNKPYASLQPGCQVSIEPKTLELSFQNHNATPQRTDYNDRQVQPGITPTPPDDEQQVFAEKLAQSVKSYLGQPYRKIDCYSLVVRGLANQGVQYGGTGGLRQHLEDLAAEQGLPTNTYLNGEGLIEIAGNKLYDQSFVRIKNAEQQSSKVLEQLQPLLQEGMLLSFSTPSRGHTGVIAKKNGQWTYVNSGMIDHQVNGGKASKRVGEEDLAEEIKNWFVLAKNKRTSLKINAGLFDTKKLKVKGCMMANNRSTEQDVI